MSPARRAPSRQRSSGPTNMRCRSVRRRSARGVSASACSHSTTMMGDVELTEPVTHCPVAQSVRGRNSSANVSSITLRPRKRQSGPVTRSSSRSSSAPRPPDHSTVRKRPCSEPTGRSLSATRSKRAKVVQHRRHSSPSSVPPQSTEANAPEAESIVTPLDNTSTTKDTSSAVIPPVPHPLECISRFYSGALSTSNSSSLTFPDLNSHPLYRGGGGAGPLGTDPPPPNAASSFAWPVPVYPAPLGVDKIEHKSSPSPYIEDDSEDSEEVNEAQTEREPSHVLSCPSALVESGQSPPTNDESGSTTNDENRSFSYSYHEDSVS